MFTNLYVVRYTRDSEANNINAVTVMVISKSKLWVMGNCPETTAHVSIAFTINSVHLSRQGVSHLLNPLASVPLFVYSLRNVTTQDSRVECLPYYSLTSLTKVHNCTGKTKKTLF